MKAYKIITVITVLLAITVITIVSIFGIYKKDEFRIVDVAPKYNFGMELSESIIINFEVDKSVKETKIYDSEGNLVEEQDEEIEYSEENGYTIIEELINDPSLYTEENFEKTKEIIINRLISGGAKQYIVSQDRETGKIGVELPIDEETDALITLLTSLGKFELIDAETEEVLMDNNDIAEATVMYAQQQLGGTSLFLQIKFDKEGTEKLAKISETYIEIKEKEEETQEVVVDSENEEEEAPSEEETQKKVSILFDGVVYQTTYFAEKMTDGTLNINMGTYTSSSEEFDSNVRQARILAVALNTGSFPVVYTSTYEELTSRVDQNTVMILEYIGLGILVAIFIVFLVKFKAKGLYASILGIGYISTLLLLVRLVNLELTIEGIMGMIIVSLLNFAFIYTMLNVMKKDELKSKDALKNTMIKFLIRLIPIYIISVIFIFATSLNVSSLGSTLFWGSFLMYVYNIIVTQVLLSVTEKGA